MVAAVVETWPPLAAQAHRRLAHLLFADSSVEHQQVHLSTILARCKTAPPKQQFAAVLRSFLCKDFRTDEQPATIRRLGYCHTGSHQALMGHTYHYTQQYQICHYSSHLADESRPADGSRSQGVAVAEFASARNDRRRHTPNASAVLERVSHTRCGAQEMPMKLPHCSPTCVRKPHRAVTAAALCDFHDAASDGAC